MDELVIDSSEFSADELQKVVQDRHGPYTRMKLLNVSNHRFLMSGLSGEKTVSVHGDPGSCFANLLDGPEVTVHGDCEDDVCDAMQDGTVIFHGSVGDVACQAMQGGRVFIKGDTGNRTGMQMREFRDKKPAIVIGGTTGEYLGEYMAGGTVILLNTEESEHPVGYNVGSGMIGGRIYIRGDIEPGMAGMNPESWEIINYLSARHADENEPGHYSKLIGDVKRLPFHVLKQIVEPDEANRIRELFYEDVPELLVEKRELTDAEQSGDVGSHIRYFSEKFEMDPKKFLLSEYTVISTDSGEPED